MYSKTTRDVTVTVEPSYQEDQSSPSENHYVWSYNVTIYNKGNKPVQLRDRYWKITDSFGNTQEIEGEGVIGEQPLIQPGESFRYTSGAPLNTPGGIMVGNYRMESAVGESFVVDIPAFSLDSPYENRVRH